MVNISDDIFATRYAIVKELFANNISAAQAAEQLASVALKDGNNEITWTLIVESAKQHPEHQDKLVNLLVKISALPAANLLPSKRQAEELKDNLYALGWHLNEHDWNGFTVAGASPTDRRRLVAGFINVNKFVARLMKTGIQTFNYSLFALWTFRTALEGPPDHTRMQDVAIEAYVPAAAAWVRILGAEIHAWDEEFESGGNKGRPGSGGPLWQGKHGFCLERWQLWRRRFGEIAEGEKGVEDEVKSAAKEAENNMMRVEEAAK